MVAGTPRRLKRNTHGAKMEDDTFINRVREKAMARGSGECTRRVMWRYINELSATSHRSSAVANEGSTTTATGTPLSKETDKGTLMAKAKAKAMAAYHAALAKVGVDNGSSATGLELGITHETSNEI